MAKKGLGTASATVLRRTNGAKHDDDSGGITTGNGAADAGRGAGIVAALRRDQEPQGGGVLELRLDQVAAHPDNPRTALGDLVGLAGSIKDLGVLQPLLVVPVAAFVTEHPEHAAAVDGADYVTTAGHRRRAAADIAGLDTIPALLRPRADRIDGYVTFVDENVHRAGLQPLEEAQVYALLADAGLSQRDIATRLRVSQGQVSKRLALLKLPQPVQDALTDGQLAVADALALTGLPTSDQQHAWELAQTQRWPLAAAVSQLAREQDARLRIAKAERQAAHEGVPLLDTDAPPHIRPVYDSKTINRARRDGTLWAQPTEHGLRYHTTTNPTNDADAWDTDHRDEDRERKKAMKARATACGQLVVTRPTSQTALADLTTVVLDGNLAYADALKMTHKWLGDRVGDTTATDAYRWHASLEAADTSTRTWVAWAMAIACADVRSRSTRTSWGPAQATYLARLVEGVDYQPTPWEQAQLDAIPAPDTVTDSAGITAADNAGEGSR